MNVSYYLDVLKYVSILWSSVLTLVALGGDYRDEQSKKLNKNGKILIGLVILSCFISFAIQFAQNTKDHKDETKKEAESQKQFNELKRLRDASERTLNPIKDATFGIVLSPEPTFEGLDGYYYRVFKATDNPKYATTNMVVIKYGTPLYPNPKLAGDQEAAYALKHLYIDVQIFKSLPKPKPQSDEFENVDLAFHIDFEDQAKSDSTSCLFFDRRRNVACPLNIFAHSKIKNLEKSGEIQSLLDLAGAYIVISVDRLATHGQEVEDIAKLYMTMKFYSCIFFIDGRSASIKMKNCKLIRGPNDNLCYLYQFAADLHDFQKTDPILLDN